MKKLMTFALMAFLIGCGNKSDDSSNATSVPANPVQTRYDDRRLNDEDLRKIESLDGRTFGQVVAQLASMSEARSFTTQDLGTLIDQKLNVKCNDVCSISRKDRNRRR